ncbi:MAG: hypothetical protein V1701_04040 [Planctomycetota bacterium]
METEEQVDLSRAEKKEDPMIFNPQAGRYFSPQRLKRKTIALIIFCFFIIALVAFYLSDVVGKSAPEYNPADYPHGVVPAEQT